MDISEHARPTPKLLSFIAHVLPPRSVSQLLLASSSARADATGAGYDERRSYRSAVAAPAPARWAFFGATGRLGAFGTRSPASFAHERRHFFVRADGEASGDPRKSRPGTAPFVPKKVGWMPRLKRAIESNGWDAVRAIAFYAWVVALSLISLVFMIAAYPLVELFDPQRRSLYDVIARAWAFLCSAPFFTVRVSGPEAGSRPEHPAGACIYVLNHQSWLDSFTVMRLRLGTKMLARADVAFNLPVIGWAMRQVGFIPVTPGRISSYRDCLDRCREYLRAGVPLVFFAEGRLAADRRPMPFQRGAFALAKELGVPIVPATIDGTGRLMPGSSELTLRRQGSPGIPGVRLVVHRPLLPTEATEEELLLAAREAVLSALPSAEDDAAFDALHPRPAPAPAPAPSPSS